MNKIKIIEVNSSTRIVDGLTKLVILKGLNPQTHKEEEWIPCGVRFFTTKKGREALEVDFSGEGYLARYNHGGGDRTWEDWENRKASNAIFCDAAPASNGGGCWWEIQVIKEGVEPISTLKKSYLDEIS